MKMVPDGSGMVAKQGKKRLGVNPEDLAIYAGDEGFYALLISMSPYRRHAIFAQGLGRSVYVNPVEPWQ